MKDGKVAIFEDDEIMRRGLRDIVNLSGNEVVILASTLAESQRSIHDRFSEYGHLALDIALVDGNLDGGESGDDGVAIAQLLSRYGDENLAIINISGVNQEIAGTHLRLSKRQLTFLLDVRKFLEGYFPAPPDSDARP